MTTMSYEKQTTTWHVVESQNETFKLTREPDGNVRLMIGTRRVHDHVALGVDDFSLPEQSARELIEALQAVLADKP